MTLVTAHETPQLFDKGGSQLRYTRQWLGNNSRFAYLTTTSIDVVLVVGEGAVHHVLSHYTVACWNGAMVDVCASGANMHP